MIITPVFGIHVPDQRTKLKDLGTELLQTATDLEAALIAASIPPVTPAPVMVARTQQARDDYWGIPGDEIARRTLQDRGATTERVDNGTTERYFATYHATTNPGGMPTPGWYVVSKPVRAAAAVPFATASGTVAVPAFGAGGSSRIDVQFPSSRFTVPPVLVVFTGEARVSAGLIPSSPTTKDGAPLVFANLTGAGSSATVAHWIATQMTPTSAAG